MVQTVKSYIIRTIVGTGEPAFSGDGQPALGACLCEPKGITIDPRGNLFIADSENHVVRKVDSRTGVITTIAGTWREAGSDNKFTGVGTAGDGLDHDPLADSTHAGPERFAQLRDLSGTVRFTVGKARTGWAAGDGGSANKATLNFPSAVAVDAQGRVYIADTLNHRVRMVDAETGVITTVAGTGQHRFSGDGGPAVAAMLNEPVALALDAQRLYIADQSNHRVRMIDLETGVITTVVGIGEATYNGDGIPATEAALAGPSGLAVGDDRALYVADMFNGRIRRIDPKTGIIETVAGDGGDYRYTGEDQEISISLSRPYGVAVESDGSLLITDSDSHLIRRWDRTKKLVSRIAGSGLAQFSGDGGPPLDSCLNFPFGVAIDPPGNIYIADTFNHRIRMITTDRDQ